MAQVVQPLDQPSSYRDSRSEVSLNMATLIRPTEKQNDAFWLDPAPYMWAIYLSLQEKVKCINVSGAITKLI
jgi:hypothetical protein